MARKMAGTHASCGRPRARVSPCIGGMGRWAAHGPGKTADPSSTSKGWREYRQTGTRQHALRCACAYDMAHNIRTPIEYGQRNGGRSFSKRERKNNNQVWCVENVTDSYEVPCPYVHTSKTFQSTQLALLYCYHAQHMPHSRWTLINSSLAIIRTCANSKVV
jgi:hypothetical protein